MFTANDNSSCVRRRFSDLHFHYLLRFTYVCTYYIDTLKTDMYVLEQRRLAKPMMKKKRSKGSRFERAGRSLVGACYMKDPCSHACLDCTYLVLTFEARNPRQDKVYKDDLGSSDCASFLSRLFNWMLSLSLV